MAKTVTAIFERGILRPLEPLDLQEAQRVRVTITEEPPEDEVIDSEYHRRLEELTLPEPLSHEEVRRRLSKIPESLVDDFFAEREERS